MTGGKNEFFFGGKSQREIQLKKLTAYRELPGLVLNPKNEFGFDNIEGCWEWGWGSFKCRCQQSMPDCTPVDGWDTVLVCDNVNGVADLGTYRGGLKSGP